MKNKIGKKVLSLLLAAVLLLGAAPFSGSGNLFAPTANALTEGYYTYTVSGGVATITKVDSSISGNVIIPSTLGGYPVTSIGKEAFAYRKSVTSITVPSGVTSIGQWAFYKCSALTSVTLSDGLKSIGSEAFSGSALTSIFIPNSVLNIGSGAFLDCSALTSIEVGEDNPNYSSEDGVLFNKEKTTLVHYPEGNTRTSYTVPDSVTNIADWTFYACSLTDITIPESVTSIGDFAFIFSNSNLTIFGVPGSCAEIFANDNDINFYPLVTGFLINPVDGSGCVIDREVCIIYGLEPGITKEQFESDFVSVRSGYSLQYSADVIGTGTVVNAVQNGSDEVVESYTIIIFGDLNGDGMIDSMDSGAVIDYENFFIDWNPSTDYARLKSGDVNGDGIVDSMDAGIIVDVENYIVEINQSTGLIAG